MRKLWMCLGLAWAISAAGQEMDKELEALAPKLASQISEQGKKKVAVIDFTDLQGASSELGRYIAEQLTVNLVVEKKGFSVVDRANLKRILQEHKLTASGLIDPENAKKLGQFAGVDALILGTVAPKKETVTLTAKIIATDTAEIAGAARAEFKLDESVQGMIARTAPERGSDAGASAPEPENEKPQVTKTFSDIRVDLMSLRIINGSDFVLTMNVSNRGKQDVWVALSTDLAGTLRGSVTDSKGAQFGSSSTKVSGIGADAEQHGMFLRPTHLPPGESTPVTVKFGDFIRKPAATGPCRVQLEFLYGFDFTPDNGKCTAYNVMGNMIAR